MSSAKALDPNRPKLPELLEYRDLRALGIRYSRPHLWRLWKAGRFPQPVKLSAARNVWPRDEITAWIAARLAARATATPHDR